MLDGFLCLYQASGRRRWLDEAVAAADGLIDLFWDVDGGVFSTGNDAEELLTRPRELMDNATPSGASLAATGFLRLEALTGESRYGEHARTVLASLGRVVGRHALGFGNLLWAVTMEVEGMTEVVVTGDRPDLVAAVLARFEPTAVLAWGEPGTGPLWEGRTGGRAYVCRDFACRAPVDTADDLTADLATPPTNR